MPADELPLPTFLVIGAQKCATRWLRLNLDEHPDVFTAARELGFFNRRQCFALGADWYRSQFAGWAGEPVVGEATPGYLMWRNDPERIAERIDATVPGVRLVAMLRDPVDRAVSAFVHHIRNERLKPDADLVATVRRVPPEDDFLGIVAGGWYVRSLQPYLDRFGDRLLVVLQDDVRDDPRAVYAAVLAHLGADPSFVPADITEVRHSYRGGARDGDRRATPEERAALFEHFRGDVDALEALLGRDLSAWRP